MQANAVPRRRTKPSGQGIRRRRILATPRLFSLPTICGAKGSTRPGQAAKSNLCRLERLSQALHQPSFDVGRSTGSSSAKEGCIWFGSWSFGNWEGPGKRIDHLALALAELLEGSRCRRWSLARNDSRAVKEARSVAWGSWMINRSVMLQRAGEAKAHDVAVSGEQSATLDRERRGVAQARSTPHASRRVKRFHVQAILSVLVRKSTCLSASS